MKKRNLSFVAIAVSCAMGVAYAEFSEHNQPLFNTDDTHRLFTVDENTTTKRSARAAYLQNDPRVKESWIININPQLISPDTQKIVLPMQDGSTAIYYLSDFEKDKDNIAVWVGGYLPKQDIERYGTQGTSVAENQAIFVRNGENITGSVTVNGQHYSIDALGNGEHALIKVDDTFPTEEPEPLEVPRFPFNQPKILPPTTEHSDIRVMIVTSEQAYQQTADLEGKVASLFAEANVGNKQSNVNITFENAGIFKVDLQDSGDLYEHLYAIEDPETPLGAQVAIARDERRADLVVWLGSSENSPTICGVAYVNAPKESAFSATSLNCIGRGAYTFAHEMGHNMGLRHNYDGTHSDVEEYAYGHRTMHLFRTIMSKKFSTENRINYWSNPDIHYNGSNYLMGTKEHANAARRLNEVREYYANFYPAVGEEEEQIVVPVVTLDQTDITVVSNDKDSQSYYVNATSDQASVTWQWDLAEGDDRIIFYRSSSRGTEITVPRGLSDTSAKIRVRATTASGVEGEAIVTVNIVSPSVDIIAPNSTTPSAPIKLQAQANFEQANYQWSLYQDGKLIEEGIDSFGQIKPGLATGPYVVNVTATHQESGRSATHSHNLYVSPVAGPVVTLKQPVLNAVKTGNYGWNHYVTAIGDQENLTWKWERLAGDERIILNPSKTHMADILVSPNVSGISAKFRVTATNAAGVPGEAIVTVNVVEPNVAISGPATSGVSSPAKLEAEANFEEPSWQWELYKGTQRITDGIDQTGQIKSGLAQGNYVVKVIATNHEWARKAESSHAIYVTEQANTDQAFIDGLTLAVETLEEDASSITFIGRISSSAEATTAPTYQWQWAGEEGKQGDAEARFTVKKGLLPQTLQVKADVTVGQLGDNLSKQFVVPARKLGGIAPAKP